MKKILVYCNGAQWCAKLRDGEIKTSNRLPQLMWMLFKEEYNPQDIEME